MVTEEALATQKARNDIAVQYGLVTKEEADLQLKAFALTTNMEILSFKEVFDLFIAKLNFIEPYRRVLFVRLMLFTLTETMKTMELDPDTVNEIQDKIHLLEFGVWG